MDSQTASIPWLGGFFALGAAFSWSIGIIFIKKSGEHIPPLLMNVIKNTMGFVLFLATALVVDGATLPDFSSWEYMTICMSGILGIGIADALLLTSLMNIGAARLALVECAYSPTILIMSMLCFAEVITLGKGMGGLLVIGGILVVCYFDLKNTRLEIGQDSWLRGIAAGVGGIVVMAVGVALMIPFLPKMSLLWLITLRLAAGVLSSVAFACMKIPDFKQQAANYLKSVLDIQNRRHTFQFLTGCFAAGFLGMGFWVAGFKYQQAGNVAILNQTSTIFTVLLAGLLLKEPIGLPKILATLLSFSGVLIMTLSGV